MALGITDRVWSLGEQFFAMRVFAGSPSLLLNRNRYRLPFDAAAQPHSLDATGRIACRPRWLGRGVRFGADRTPA